MPDSAVIAALTSLLPSLPATNKPFPSVLLSHCESLLALSRQRASNLKPEEEIARAHACSEIACLRLRAQLRLPAIKNGVGAPCQPKVYAKLVKFLEKTLGDSTVGGLTPRGKKRDGDGKEKENTTSGGVKQSGGGAFSKRHSRSDATPSKTSARTEVAGSTFVGTVKMSRQLGTGNAAAGTDDKAPVFVMPSIRKLCKIFSTPSLAPHVYTGTCIVLKLADIWSPDTEMTKQIQADVSALITAVYLMVLTRMQEDQMTTETYTQVTGRSIEELKLGSDAIDEVEQWISRLNDEGWCNGADWWDSVPESVLTFDPQAQMNGRTETTGAETDDIEPISRYTESYMRRSDLSKDHLDGVLLPGLGTMLHDAIDWTSEDRCSDYREWSARIMKELSTPVKPIGRRSKAVTVG